MIEFLLNNPRELIKVVLFCIIFGALAFLVLFDNKERRRGNILISIVVLLPLSYFLSEIYSNYRADKNIKMIQYFSKEEKESYINKLSKKEKKKMIEKLEEIKTEEELEQKINELFIEDRKKNRK
ncbi:hypothetical protein [Fusobacterium necrophorum]|uniref:hypothetical protein n=1 Tax=Fusobacterium necrophorum TaxID=859 RepID=UPI00047F2236|nr:hypothetical protein [Fusobacterium necrophorum]